jgi:hypothetical protein
MYDTAAQYVAAVALDCNVIGLLHCKYWLLIEVENSCCNS